MKHALVGLVILGVGIVEGRSLSYRLKASEGTNCFYAFVDPKVDMATAQLQFYFAASDLRGAEPAYTNYKVIAPTGQELQQAQHITHSEVNVKPTMGGEYALCLSHSGSPTDKNIDVDVSLPIPPPTVDEETGLSKEELTDSHKLEETVQRLKRELGDLVHTMRKIKGREKRHMETVGSISSLIFYFSLFEVVLIFGMSFMQITVLRMFFGTGSSKSRGF